MSAGPFRINSDTPQCQGSVPLTNETFSLSFFVEDGFGSVIFGPFLNSSSLFMSMSQARGSQCQAVFEQDESVDPVSGRATFRMNLLGRFDSTCTFSTRVHSSSLEVLGGDPLQLIPSEECSISFRGCPQGEVLHEGEDYDICVRTCRMQQIVCSALSGL